MREFIRKVVKNPYVDLIVGAVLIISGLIEVFSTLPQDLSDLKLGSHHAVIVLGLVTVLRSIVDIFAGVEFLDKSSELRKKE
ncbi:MAG: hypothetical protein M1450_00630 [Patescibacteria group bacterium]|nr:hypothetical protein [Patescibacteria group bacterium]